MYDKLQNKSKSNNKNNKKKEQQNKQQHAIFAYSFGRQAIRVASLGYAWVGSWRFCLNFQDIRSEYLYIYIKNILYSVRNEFACTVEHKISRQ